SIVARLRLNSDNLSKKPRQLHSPPEMQKSRVLTTGSLRLKQMKHHQFSPPLASHKHANSSNKAHSDVWTSRGRFKIKFELSRWPWRCLRIAIARNRRHYRQLQDRRAA